MTKEDLVKIIPIKVELIRIPEIFQEEELREEEIIQEAEIYLIEVIQEIIVQEILEEIVQIKGISIVVETENHQIETSIGIILMTEVEIEIRERIRITDHVKIVNKTIDLAVIGQTVQIVETLAEI